MDKVEPGNLADEIKELVDNYEDKIKLKDAEIKALENLIIKIIDLQPTPELTETKAV